VIPIEGTGQWDIYKPLLADPNLAPVKSDITFASAVFREFLQIRKSSPLFRLQTADQIKKDVSFLNTGTEQIPGLIVMRLNDTDNIDSNYKEVLIFFNARPDAVSFSDALLNGEYVLHSIQQNSADEVVKQASFDNNSFNVPGRTTAIFMTEEARPTPQPTAETTSIPSSSSNSSTLTIAGIIAALLVISGLGIFLRRRQKT
jgi:LPXTG-motif cell wall-anchored protein